MEDRAKAVVGLFLCFCLTGCGGGNSAPQITAPTVTSVVVNCSQSSITTAQTSACTASVSGTGSYSSAVSWSANSGTVSSAGIFTPGAAGTATVTATSTQDPSKSGSSNVTVSTASTITSVAVNCSPSSITAAQTSTCTASVSGTGSYSSTVSWSATGGTVTNAGFFTPSVIGTATVIATSTQDSSKSGSANVTTQTPNPTPAIAAISPNSMGMGVPGFTLSVVGSNFISRSKVLWNGMDVGPITLTSSELLTVQIPSSAVAASGPDFVTVVNPSPGGGTSNSLSFAVPCPIPASIPASNQTRARLGAYYFDGWSGPLTNFHFQGLPLGPYKGRQPLSGWQDFSACSVEQQLASAHNSGIDFFVFDWYFNAQAYDPEENLNSALQITHTLSNRHGMQYAILYVDGAPFIVQEADWSAAVAEWVGYMSDPAYVRVNGRPLFVIFDVSAMRTAFGSSAAVSSAFNHLRAAAQSAGLPGVYIAGGISAGYDRNTQNGVFPDTSDAVADGYDALTLYNYAWFGTVTGEQPFWVLSESGKWIWSQAATKSTLPFIPVVMDGWDPRPWGGVNVWFDRSPQDVSSFVNDAIAWTSSHPQLRPEPAPTPPLILLEAWNELGEGSYLIPTFDDGTSYGDSLAATLMGP